MSNSKTARRINREECSSLKRQFLRVQVIVKVWRAYNLNHYIKLDPVCRLNACGTALGNNHMLQIVFPLSDKAS
jgi:hypothetical protein